MELSAVGLYVLSPEQRKQCLVLAFQIRLTPNFKLSNLKPPFKIIFFLNYNIITDHYIRKLEK